MRKHVESTFVSLDGVISDPQKFGPPYWNDEHADYNRDLLFAAEIAALKQQRGQNIFKYGTGELDLTLLMPNNLVDEFHFWLFPVAVGRGDRLLDGIDMTHLKLAGTTTFTTGIVVLRYEPKDEKG